MKTLRIIYIIAVSICTIELLVFLFSPFGGLLGILNLIETGMFTAQKGDQVIYINSIYYPGNDYVRNLEILNRTCTIGYFLSLLGGCLSLLLHRLNKKIQYKIGIALFASSLVFSLLGGALWRFLVHNYIF